MNNKCKKCILIIVCVCIATTVGAFEIELNGRTIRSSSTADLKEIARSRYLQDSIQQSVALEELLPICSTLDKITVIARSGQATEIRTQGDVLQLYRSYVLPKQNGEIAFIKTAGQSGPEIQVEDVKSISVDAERVDSDELEVWISWEGVPELKDEIRRWARLHTIDLKVNEVPKSDSKLLSVLRGGGSPPDVVLIQSDYIPPLTAARALQPVVRFPTDQFADKSLDALSLDGRLWAVPFYFDAQMLFYRSDLMSLPKDPGQGGVVKWDLEEFERIAREVQERGTAPASWNAYSAYWLIPFQLGFGKQHILESDGTVRVDDQATIDAVSYLKRLKDEGVLDLRERDSMFSRFIAGEVAMMLSASFSIPELERLDVDFGVAPFPDGPQGPVAPLLDFKGFAVARKTRRPILARRFLLSMSDPAVQHSFTQNVFKLPVTESAWNLAAERNPYFPVLRHAYDSGIPVPSTKGYKVYKNTMWKMLRFLLTGKLPVVEGLERAQSLIDKQMSR